MNAGTYQVNITYRLNLATLRRLDTELSKIARKFKTIPVNIKVTGNVTAVKSQLSDMKKRYRSISSRVNITSNIKMINNQLDRLKNRRVNVAVNYTGNAATPRAPSSPSGSSNNSNRASRRSSITERVGRGIASRGIYDVGTTIARVPLSAVQTAASYEEVMIDIKSTLAALGDGTPKQIAEMDKLIKKIGLTTRFTSTQAAQAAQMLIRNGVNAQGILDGMLESTVSTSIVMRSDLSTTADLMTDVMAFYRDMGVSAEEASNKIVAGTLTSKFGLTDMYHALANGGTEAANYGVKLDELTTIISLISPSFKSGRKAGTSFLWFLRSFTGKSDKAKAAMEDLGLKLTDKDGKWKSTRDIIKELTRVFGSMAPKQRNAAIASVFHGEAINTVLGLLREGVAGYDAMMKKQGELNTSELARVKSTNGLQMAYANLTSAVDALYKVIVNDSVLQWMTEFTKTITESIRWISNLIAKLDVLKDNKVWKILTWDPKDLAKSMGQKFSEFDDDVSEYLIEGAKNYYQKLRQKLDSDYKPPEKPAIPTSASEAYSQYGRARTGNNAINKFNSLPSKDVPVIQSYEKSKNIIGNVERMVVVPEGSGDWRSYLDKEQREVLKPVSSTNSSVSNSSAQKNIVVQRGAVQINGADVSQPHATKQAVTDGIKKAVTVDSDGFRVFDFNGG